MRDAVSLGMVLGLWLALSLGLWWYHRRTQRRRRKRQRELVALIAARVNEAQAVFDAIRQPPQAEVSDHAANPPAPDDIARRRLETTALLRRIQDHGDYFDAVRALFPRIRSELGLPDCPPLTEVMQIRRDLWASSEIILVEDLKALGDAFASEGAYETFVEEAERLLFLGRTPPGEDDPIDLRLAVARADIDQFARDIEADIALAEDEERLPTPAEIVAYPIAAVRALPGQIRLASAYFWEFVESVKLGARTIRESDTLATAMREVRRAREDLPQRLSSSFEKAAALARQGRKSIAAQHDFLVKAYDLQGKYQEMLVRAPELSERGRQFIARLELAKRSEQLRERSKGAWDDLKRLMVKALAHLIAALQKAQERLAPPEPAAAGHGHATSPLRDTGSSMRREMRATQRMVLSRDAETIPPSAENSKQPDKPRAPVASVRVGRAPFSPKPQKPADQAPETAPSAAPVEKAEPPSEETLARLRSLFSSRRRPERRPVNYAVRSEDDAGTIDSKEPLSSASPVPSPAISAPPQAGSPPAAEPSTPVGPDRADANRPAPSGRRLWPGLDRLRRTESEVPSPPVGLHAESDDKPPASPRYAGPQAIADREASPSAAGDGSSRASGLGRLRAKLFGAPGNGSSRVHREDSAIASPRPPDKPTAEPESRDDSASRGGREKREAQKSTGIAAMLRRLADEEDLDCLDTPQPRAKPQAKADSLIARLSKLETAELEAIGYGLPETSGEAAVKAGLSRPASKPVPGARAFPILRRRKD